MAMPFELALFGNETSGLLGIMGGNVLLLGGLVAVIGLLILVMLRLPLQMMMPFFAFLLLIVAAIVPPLQTILWLIAGVMMAFFIFKLTRGY